MPNSNSKTLSRKSGSLSKPKKPHAKFPLTPHATGKWMKKIGGKIHYFGQWAKRIDGELVRVEGDGWRAAQKEYERWVFEQMHGRQQASKNDDGLTVGKLCNLFLDVKGRGVKSGKLSPRTFTDYKQATDLIVTQFGERRLVGSLGPLDFQELRSRMEEAWDSPDRIGKFVTCIRSVFKYAIESKLIAETISYGPEFKKPSASEFRRHRGTGGKRMFTPQEVDQLLNGKFVKVPKGKSLRVRGGSVQMRAMVLLGLNCGFGNTDVGSLPLSAIDFKSRIIDFPRTKTAIERRCPLWPETIKALQAAIAERGDRQRSRVRHSVGQSLDAGHYRLGWP